MEARLVDLVAETQYQKGRCSGDRPTWQTSHWVQLEWQVIIIEMRSAKTPTTTI